NCLINDTFLAAHLSFPDYGNINNQLWAVEAALPAVLLVGLFAITRIYRNFFRNTTKAKRAIQMLMILSIISLTLMVTGKQNPRQEFSFLSIPLSIYFAIYFSSTNFNLLREILNLILLLTVLFF